MLQDNLSSDYEAEEIWFLVIRYNARAALNGCQKEKLFWLDNIDVLV